VLSCNIEAGEKMAAIAKVLSGTFDTSSYVEVSRTIATFCGVALVVYFMVASYGIDLSPGFF
jgi:hypothetical protein